MTLVITEKDMAIFEERAKQKDIQALYEYCQETFPGWFAIMGKDSVLNVIYQILEQAKTNRLTLKGSIQLYLYAAIVLGSRFECDKQYALFHLSHANETDKMLHLYEKLNAYSEQVLGQDEQFYKDMLFKMANARLPMSGDVGEIVAFYTQLYPQKVGFIGKEVYGEFIEQGREQALSVYGFERPEQYTFYLLLQFILGQYFDKDITCCWLNWQEIVTEIRLHNYTLASLANTLTRIVITGV